MTKYILPKAGGIRKHGLENKRRKKEWIICYFSYLKVSNFYCFCFSVYWNWVITRNPQTVIFPEPSFLVSTTSNISLRIHLGTRKESSEAFHLVFPSWDLRHAVFPILSCYPKWRRWKYTWNAYGGYHSLSWFGLYDIKSRHEKTRLCNWHCDSFWEWRPLQNTTTHSGLLLNPFVLQSVKLF